MPDKSFESLNMFERFKRAPPIKDPTGNVMELGRLVPNALLFGKSALKTKDGITSVTTFSAFCARPKHYNSPGPLGSLIFSEARLRLAVHGYGVGGDAREVIFGCLHERADGTVCGDNARTAAAAAVPPAHIAAHRGTTTAIAAPWS